MPSKFQDEEGEILIGVERDENMEKKAMLQDNIRVFAWLGICYILYLPYFSDEIIMGESTTDLWLKALLITAIIDYLFLQTSKGFILMCCL